jgi:hypothetical protein
MPRRAGLILLILLSLGLFYARTALAGSPGTVQVAVSPLALLMRGEVTVRVGGAACTVARPATSTLVCPDLPPGEHVVTAEAPGYTVVPAQYPLFVTADGVASGGLQFNLYRADHQVRLPLLAR